MIAHLLKLVWNRKKLNGLVMVEIFFSFIVLFVVLTAAFHLWEKFRRPLGFEWQDVWSVSIDVGEAGDDKWSAEAATRFATLLDELRRMPEIDLAAGALYAPYDFGSTNGEIAVDGNDVRFDVNEVTDEFASLMRLEIIDGRFFSPEDDANPLEPLVVDRDFAASAFGEETAVGREIDFWGDTRARIVGVVEEYRPAGEFSPHGNFMFRRVRVGNAESRPPPNILVRFAGTLDARFEKELISRLQPLAPVWSFEVRSLSSLRDTRLRFSLLPVLTGGVIALFMVLMVGLGLVGVLWQNITRRTDEIGLRRAVGATEGSIHRQILLETLIIATFGMLAGLILILQIPVLGIVSFLDPTVFAAGLVTATVTIYLLAIVCSLYPSWLASRVQPALALQHE